MWRLDARIPVVFGVPRAAVEGCAWLVEGDQPAPKGVPTMRFTAAATGHAAGCACCMSRNPAAVALGNLFLARARGETELFQSVVAITSTPAGRAAVLAALATDALVSAWFRSLS